MADELQRAIANIVGYESNPTYHTEQQQQPTEPPGGAT